MSDDMEKERDYYRELSNQLGGQLLRLRDEHTRAMSDARRSRSTTLLIRRLYRLDQMNVNESNLANIFLETALEALTVECGMILRLRNGSRAFELVASRGCDHLDVAELTDKDVPTGFAFRSSLVEPDPFARNLTRLTDMPYFLWAYDSGSGIALFLGNRNENLQLRRQFRDEDREIVETALDVFVNIAQRKRVEQQLVHDAFHDALTGLPNRALFIEHLDQAMARARRSDFFFAVFFLDLDRFKLVNDSLGHAAGDDLLKGISGRLRRAVRPGDIVARLGGDEFAVLAEGMVSPEDAALVAERIHGAMQDPFEINGQSIFASASIGIAKSAERYANGAELLRDADIAMYSAKELGGAAHKLFDSDMHVVMVSRLELETDLRQAIERGELRMVYQPIIDLQKDALCGFEALLRWMHPLKGLLLPRDFIPLAEETGLILPIGNWVLEQVARQVHDWRSRHDSEFFIALNLSDREFIQPEFVELFEGLLKKYDIPAGGLEIELTERMLMRYSSIQNKTLPRLREQGVRISIDDFGTGYSSLSRLQRLPIDKLKIDQSFIRGMTKSKESLELVKTVLAMGHNLGMQCVAEGIETRSQARQLRKMNCEFGQGFLFARPANAVNAESAFNKSRWMPIW